MSLASQVQSGFTAAAAEAKGLRAGLMPTGALAASLDRRHCQSAGLGALVSGRLSLQAVRLHAGQTISSITFMAGTTAGATLSNTWFAIYSDALARLATTVNDTSASWGASSTRTLAITGGYAVTTTGLHYLGICVQGTTVPNLIGNNGIPLALNGLAPILFGTSTTGLTNAASAPATAAAMSAASGHAYAYVS